MSAICRVAHVLAVSLWFGSVAFFTVAGLLIFQAMEEAARSDAPWLAAPTGQVVEGLPAPRLERGSRAAGAVVGRIFPFYFALQAGCAVVALLTALRLGGRVRLAVCVLGAAAVAGGWMLQQKVSHLREERNTRTDEAYAAAAPSKALVADALAARRAFGVWHGISLLANFAALGLSGWLAAARSSLRFGEGEP